MIRKIDNYVKLEKRQQQKQQFYTMVYSLFVIFLYFILCFRSCRNCLVCILVGRWYRFHLKKKYTNYPFNYQITNKVDEEGRTFLRKKAFFSSISSWVSNSLILWIEALFWLSVKFRDRAINANINRRPIPGSNLIKNIDFIFWDNFSRFTWVDA